MSTTLELRLLFYLDNSFRALEMGIFKLVNRQPSAFIYMEALLSVMEYVDAAQYWLIRRGAVVLFSKAGVVAVEEWAGAHSSVLRPMSILGQNNNKKRKPEMCGDSCKKIAGGGSTRSAPRARHGDLSGINPTGPLHRDSARKVAGSRTKEEGEGIVSGQRQI